MHVDEEKNGHIYIYSYWFVTFLFTLIISSLQTNRRVWKQQENTHTIKQSKISSSVHSSKANQLLTVYSSGPGEFSLSTFLFIRNPSLLWRKMASNSSILALEIPWTEDPGGLWSTWLQKVSHEWACMHSRSSARWRHVWLRKSLQYRPKIETED